MRTLARFFVPTVTFLAVLASTTSAFAGTRHAYLTATSATQGQIRGGVTQKGFEGTMLVTGYEFGQGAAHTLIIHKDSDQSTPLLLSASVSGEHLTRFTLNFYAPNAAGIDKNYFRVELTNARITGFRQVAPVVTGPAGPDVVLHDDITLTYDKITWTWLDPTTISTSG